MLAAWQSLEDGLAGVREKDEREDDLGAVSVWRCHLILDKVNCTVEDGLPPCLLQTALDCGLNIPVAHGSRLINTEDGVRCTLLQTLLLGDRWLLAVVNLALDRRRKRTR